MELFCGIVILGLLVFIIIHRKYSKPLKDLNGNVALVTGGANGLGKILSKSLARIGCKVAIADIDIKNATKTVQEILQQNKNSIVKAYKVDISKLNEIEDLREQILKDFGTVDILINNAAIIFVPPIDEAPPESLEKMMSVNVMSVVWTTRVFLKDMIEKKRGHIVSIASLAGLMGSCKLRLYTTTKFAVRGFMEALSLDLYREKHHRYVKTTTVFPTFIDTNNDVFDFTKSLYKYTTLLDSKSTVKQIIYGIRKNHRIVAIPNVFFFFGYLIQIPYDINRLVVKFFTNPDDNNMKLVK